MYIAYVCCIDFYLPFGHLVKQPEEASKEVEKEARKGKQSSGKQIEKYRKMLKSIQEKDKKKEEDKGMEMEITWVPGRAKIYVFPCVRSTFSL